MMDAVLATIFVGGLVENKMSCRIKLISLILYQFGAGVFCSCLHPYRGKALTA